MRKTFAVLVVLMVAIHPALITGQQAKRGGRAGQPLVIELDNEFIKKYANRATITSDFTITGMSADHKPDKDGEVHVGGWAHEAGLPCVSEVMNVATVGKLARDAFKALKAGKKVSVTGAWRIWGEHAGGGSQIQATQLPAKPPMDKLPGAPSNPDHVFEIHPVTSLKVGDTETDATKAIGNTPGFTPKDAHFAFTVHFEKAQCKIIPKGKRTRIVTEAVQLNFTEFLIRPEQDVKKMDDDGHSVICTVFDTDGELLVRNRRMIFIPGTNADLQVQNLKKDGVLQVTGFARLDLALVQWRVENQNATDKDGKAYDVSPLEWRLPYELIIVAAKPFNGNLDD
jgi:hypothetical protein